MVDSKLLATIPEIQLTQDVNTERVWLGIVVSYVEVLSSLSIYIGPRIHLGVLLSLPTRLTMTYRKATFLVSRLTSLTENPEELSQG